MTLKQRCLLTSGSTILSVVVVLGGASAASSTRPSAVTQHRPHGIQLLHRQTLYNYYNYPIAPVVRPGCYLPSDGCLSEYSVQN
jgi:hypothetical protein